jgi:hypothetical protein
MIDKKIFIVCPATGAPVPTGFRAPAGTDLTGLNRVKMAHCPACRGEHIWNGEDGFWKEGEPEPSTWKAFRQRRRSRK